MQQPGAVIRSIGESFPNDHGSALPQWWSSLLRCRRYQVPDGLWV